MQRTALVAGIALLLAAAPAAASPAKVVVKAAYNKQLKTMILVDGNGLSLYLWVADTIKNESLCRADAGCTSSWPPVFVSGKPTAGPGIKPSLLGTTTDGKQVTYNGHPLYRFRGGGGYGAPDKKPGQLNGQGLFQVWYVVSPKGAAIKKS